MTKYCELKLLHGIYLYNINEPIKSGIGANIMEHNMKQKQHVDDFNIVFNPMNSTVMTGIMTTIKR